MSDTSFKWNDQLQEIILNLDQPDSSAKVAHLRDALTVRLRILTPVDNDERKAIEGALSRLEQASGLKGRNDAWSVRAQRVS
jgi:hypothetical protein